MKRIHPFRSITLFFREQSLSFIKENGRLITQFILMTFFIGLGIWFIKHEQAELHEVKRILVSSKLLWLLAGIGLTICYIIFQGLMYVFAFRSVQCNVGLGETIVLFLKRNFISIFLPAGGVSSLAFFTSEIEKKGITKSQIFFASSLYGFVGILSVVIVAIPAFIYGLLKGSSTSNEWYALSVVIVIIAVLFFSFRSLQKKSWAYRIIVRFFPFMEVFIEEIQNNSVEKRHFFSIVLVSLFIEIVGILSLFVATAALKLQPSFYIAVMGYIISVIFMIVSPFLRGLGAIEVSLAFILTRFGFTSVEAMAITFLYRFFEFWLPLFAGLLSFFIKINKLLLRILPAAFLLMLGIINIVSVLTPAIAWRVERLREFFIPDTINASNIFVLIAGLFLLITAAFMLKGLRSAWWFALFLSIISMVGHLTKAIDYEEAIAAFIVIVILFFTRKEYFIKTNPKLKFVGLQTALFSIAAVLVYGTIGFYLLDKKHFSIDFNLMQSIRYTLQNYFLIGSSELIPNNTFAGYFLYSINISGILSMAFLIYTLILPYLHRSTSTPDEINKAKELTEKFGKSALDYFKTYPDKLLFMSPGRNAFIAYRVKANYAVVLENPVAENDFEMTECVISFDKFCYENSLKSIYFRVPEESLGIYKELGKKNLFIGQEAVLDLNTFTMEGGERKSLRNAINKLKDRGFRINTHTPPVKDGILQKIKAVSDEWLENTDRDEIIFSQGMFAWNELKQQILLTVENAEDKIIAFLNIIPDYTKDEATYDLIRKTSDAPGGVMDFILIELFNYSRAHNYQFINLGFAPLSGISEPQNFPERSMKFAYEKIRSFTHYKGLRDFKDKYAPDWYNKYIIYDNYYDLFQIPGVLSKVIKP
jgi:phosphatidylglycerol lysyltransferase